MSPVVAKIALGAGLCGLASGWSGSSNSSAVAVQAVQDVQAVVAELFEPIPGHRELSGRLLVMPRRASESPDAGSSDAADRDQLARELIGLNAVGYLEDLDLFVVDVPDGSSESQYGTELLNTGLYEYVAPDWVLFPLGSPNDPEYPLQWHLPRVHAPHAWRFTQGSPGVVVAFVDTGVDLTHSDLSGVLVPGYNSYWLSRKAQSNGGKVSDDNGHGTSVAGAAVAIANNNAGGCGVAWNLRIMPIRTTNPNNASDGAYTSDMINGATWAANHGAKIVSISYAGVGESIVESLGATLRGKGALLVWAMDTLSSPTTFDHPDVVVVNGTDSADNAYAPVNWGPGVDLAAPAVSLWIPMKGGGYGLRTGNSFAAPIVAASAGLAWSVDPALTPAQVELALRASAEDIGFPGKDLYFGYGLVDPYVAVVDVLLGATHPVPSPHTLLLITPADVAFATSRGKYPP